MSTVRPRPCLCDKESCPLCWRFHNDPRYHKRWGGTLELPSLPRRAVNFAKAVASHLSAGRPKATQEQIDARLEVCKACPLFVYDVCTHPTCGCNVGRRQRFLNKLAWADQECPIGKWGRLDHCDHGESPSG